MKMRDAFAVVRVDGKNPKIIRVTRRRIASEIVRTDPTIWDTINVTKGIAPANEELPYAVDENDYDEDEIDFDNDDDEEEMIGEDLTDDDFDSTEVTITPSYPTDYDEEKFRDLDIGDTLYVKGALSCKSYGDIMLSPDMLDYAGDKVTVKSVDGDWIYIEEDGGTHVWTPQMFQW